MCTKSAVVSNSQTYGYVDSFMPEIHPVVLGVISVSTSSRVFVCAGSGSQLSGKSFLNRNMTCYISHCDRSCSNTQIFKKYSHKSVTETGLDCQHM